MKRQNSAGSARAVARYMVSNARALFACMVLAAWLVASTVSLVWTPYPLLERDGYHIWQSPSRAHWLGTDGTGADIASWMLKGSAHELVIVLCAVLVALAVGLPLALASTRGNRLLSQGVTVAIDTLIAVPTVLLAMLLAVPFGPTLIGVIVACGVGYGLNLARTLRPSLMLAYNQPYVTNAQLLSLPSTYILRTHILPHIMPVLVVQLTQNAGTAILAEAGLTYLGVGVPSQVASWGYVLSTTVQFISVAPTSVLWPGLIVTLVVLALNLFGDALRSALDPRHNVFLAHSYAARLGYGY